MRQCSKLTFAIIWLNAVYSSVRCDTKNEVALYKTSLFVQNVPPNTQLLFRYCVDAVMRAVPIFLLFGILQTTVSSINLESQRLDLYLTRFHVKSSFKNAQINVECSLTGLRLFKDIFECHTSGIAVQSLFKFTSLNTYIKRTSGPFQKSDDHVPIAPLPAPGALQPSSPVGQYNLQERRTVALVNYFAK